jgi:hypothetical protein
MITRLGFKKLQIEEFADWIASVKMIRSVSIIQHHHTQSPAYALFDGNNHFDLQQRMKNFHIHRNGWKDIGQHFTTFPDGSILTGASLDRLPSCIAKQNTNSICIEHLGNFDIGRDEISTEHRETIVRMTAILCKRFGLLVNTQSIVYHHWFDPATGHRNDGAKNQKSCPGSNFFGGNKVQDCLKNFLPLVADQLAENLV